MNNPITYKPAHEMQTKELVTFLKDANLFYRIGEPIISDDQYDHEYLPELERRDSAHPYLTHVEPDPVSNGKKVQHANPMLSTDKAYTQEQVNKFIDRIKKAAVDDGINEEHIIFRITAKLDGNAGNYAGGVLATRGEDGLTGNDMTNIIQSGVKAINGINTGAGEVVILKSYFEKHLAEEFMHPRNFVAGVISADDLSEHAIKALADEAIHFVPFSSLESKLVSCSELISSAEQLCQEVETQSPYPVDGSVIEVMNSTIRQKLGSTSHHHCWQLAKKSKQNSETASASVLNTTWQVGRTSVLTPVINILPTTISGAVVSNITGKHAGYMLNNNIGLNAIIRFERAGHVIPNLLSIEKYGKDVVIPSHCPICQSTTEWRKAKNRSYLVCTGASCRGQVEAQLRHYFSILGNVDLFGPKTISILVDYGIRDVRSIYALPASRFELMGFGPKQSENLVNQLERSRNEPVHDWKFLAAFGIPYLGRGDSRKFLSYFPINSLGSLTKEDIKSLNGFGNITSESIVESFASRWKEISGMLDLGFNLITDSPNNSQSAISNKKIVFTGSMTNPRELMKETALSLGATVQSGVSKTTDLLIIGERVGEKKLVAAKNKNVKIITELEYLKLIA